MNKNLSRFLLTLLFIIPPSMHFGQDIHIGKKDSIESGILKETRRIYINLPKGYHNSGKAYPVIYRLDGNLDLYIETVGAVHRLAYAEQIMPEVIVVLIENTDRNRDMMPTNTTFFKGEPGAAKFKEFIENELFLHMRNSYRITDEKVLCGQSLSSLFAIYCLLTSPELFDSYIASSAGFPDCEPFFIPLTEKMLESGKKDLKKVFLSYGAKDFLDPEGVIEKQLSRFTRSIASDPNIDYRYKIYSDEGHVPYQSFYHGLKFIYE